MYHIDRNNLLQLPLHDKLIITKGTSNCTLNAFVTKAGRLVEAYGLLEEANYFNLDDRFPIKDLFEELDPKEFPLENGKFLHKYRIELIYEFIRATLHPEQVSRFEGFYLTQNPDEWIKALKVKNGASLYQFSAINITGEEHDAVWPEKSMESLDFEQIVDHASNYWSGYSSDYFRSEIICIGELLTIGKYIINIPTI